ncbi:MAG: hypothetical protein VX815_07770 [Gemmatimonadota bacterium]|nr:hypothetical protein [Gemmatimonadota bacterium]
MKVRRPAGWVVAVFLVVTALAEALAAQAAPEPPAPDSVPVARRVGTMSDLMVRLIYPASDAIFYITTRTPTTSAEWTELEGTTMMLAESANLLMMPSRAKGREQWMRDAKLLLDVGEAAYWAAKEKDVAALEALNDQLYQSCVQCHRNFRTGYGRRR